MKVVCCTRLVGAGSRGSDGFRPGAPVAGGWGVGGKVSGSRGEPAAERGIGMSAVVAGGCSASAGRVPGNRVGGPWAGDGLARTANPRPTRTSA